MPENLADALNVLHNGGTKIVAGGTDFYPSLKQGERHDSLLDVTRVSELNGIQQTTEGCRIGAATKWTEIVNADLPRAFHGLQLAGREVGSIQIQNQGTIAGNICNASPAADGVPPLLTLNATVELASVSGKRTIPISEFIIGSRQTDLQPNEIVVAILIPKTKTSLLSSFIKLGSRKYLVISIAMVSVLIEMAGEKIKEARIAVGSCSAVAKRLVKLENFLVDQSISNLENHSKFASQIESVIDPITDHRATSKYRKDSVPELVFRALNQAISGEKI